VEEKVLLEIKSLDSGYGFLQVLWDISLQVDEGEFVALIGPNGAGKSTTLKTIAGLVAPQGGEIRFAGDSIGGMEGHLVCRKGIAYISEELNLFVNMTVKENLQMGAFTVKDPAKQAENLKFVYELFPRLYEREGQYAGTLSGGERKMMAIGRGIMSSPRLMLVDEPSLGLAPMLTNEVFRALRTLNKRGTTILLVEQNVGKTLKTTSRAYILEKGKIVLDGESAELTDNDHVRKIYLGH
jgi:ABC-type branched-subunit amino acid transport system ATPase component